MKLFPFCISAVAKILCKGRMKVLFPVLEGPCSIMVFFFPSL